VQLRGAIPAPAVAAGTSEFPVFGMEKVGIRI
jgi:hypothetical protein